MTTPQSSFRKNLIKTLIPLVSIIAIAVAIAYLMKQSGEGPHGPDDGHDHGVVQLKAGEAFPDIEMSDLEGKSRALSSFKGKLLILNLWATWCEACMVEMPSLQKLNDQFKDQGVEVWALSLDEEFKTEVPPAVKKMGLTLPVFVDPGQHLSEILGVEVIPVTYIIHGEDRKLLAIEEGERDWMSASIHEKVEGFLKAAPSADSVHPAETSTQSE